MQPSEPTGVAEYVTRAWHDREIHHLRELLDEREAASQNALVLQAREYERRLEILNHAHTQAVENWRTSLPRELFVTFEARFTAFERTNAAWREAVIADITAMKTAASTTAMANTRFFSAVVAGVTILFSILTFWLRARP